MALTPYVVGQWVRRERFYGRGALLREILEGNRNCVWVVGTRRIGKTSLLKQLEHLTASAPDSPYVPLFWDFQGAESESDLEEGFFDALIDAGERLQRLGIAPRELVSGDLFAALAQVRRELAARGRTLLLLGDEVEELVPMHERDPRLLRRLRRALQSPESIRTVFASTIRLWRLAREETSTSPFLHGFTPPLALRELDDEAARALVRQLQLPAEARPALDDAAVEAIVERAGRHPYLLQILGERSLELGDVERAAEAAAADPMVSFFFAADLAMLDDTERAILRRLERDERATGQALGERLALDSGVLRGGLGRLELLGLAERSADDAWRMPNPFFRRWFAELPPEQKAGRESDSGNGPTVRTRAPGPAGFRPIRIDGRYDLQARLGRGATGEVYKAHDTLLRTTVAIKLVHPTHVLDEESTERLRREVVLTRDLSHRNILKVYHLGSDGERLYLTMQLVEGSDLGRLIAHQAPLAAGRVLDLAEKLAGALEALHGSGVLHRDLKPSNILVDAAGEPLLADFGMARFKWAPGVTTSGLFLGTPAYASPEHVGGRNLDERSDLYALGVVLFEALTGRLPFFAENLRELLTHHLVTPPPVPHELVPAVPPELSRLVLRCLAKEADERVQSAEELRRAVAGLRSATS